MKALVKKYAEPGLWLEEVPVPEYGINDVLIKVHKTSICGTDVHIWNWDAWAQRTIPVPMVIGHEFVGHGCCDGQQRTRPGDRRRRLRRGSHRLRQMPELPGGTPPPVQRHPGRRRQPARRLCGVRLHPGHQHLARRSQHPHGHPVHLRSLRQCDPHSAGLHGAGRGCADHRAPARLGLWPRRSQSTPEHATSSRPI